MSARIDREAVQAELLELLDEADQRAETLKEHVKTAREAIAAVLGRAKERRELLAGKRGVQLSLTDATLADAGKVAKRKRRADDHGDCAAGCGLPAARLVFGEWRCRGCADVRAALLGAEAAELERKGSAT